MRYKPNPSNISSSTLQQRWYLCISPWQVRRIPQPLVFDHVFIPFSLRQSRLMLFTPALSCFLRVSHLPQGFTLSMWHYLFSWLISCSCYRRPGMGVSLNRSQELRVKVDTCGKTKNGHGSFWPLRWKHRPHLSTRLSRALSTRWPPCSSPSN